MKDAAPKRKLTYANVVSTLCLFFLIGGGAAYAGSQLGKNSVGPEQLKKNSVTSSKVKDRSLLPDDFQSARLPAGPKGDPGPPGPAGPPADEARLLGLEKRLSDAEEWLAETFTYVLVRTEIVQSDLGETVEKYVMCEPWEAATGGGYSTGNEDIAILDSGPAHPQANPDNPPDGWLVKAKNNLEDNYSFTVWAVCAG